MQIARRVGEHLQDVVLGLIALTGCFESFRLVPSGLPFGLNIGWCVGGHGFQVFQKQTPSWIGPA